MWLQRPVIDELLKQAAVFGTKLGVSLIILACFWIAGTIVKKIVARIARGHDSAKEDIINLVGQIARISLLVFGSITALGTLGINVSALVAGLGLTGFALGFAFRDVLSNVVAGILILIHRPFRHGDRISVMGFEGLVIGIDLRYTALENDEKVFLIPNSSLFTNPLSLTKPQMRPQVVSPAPEPGAQDKQRYAEHPIP